MDLRNDLAAALAGSIGVAPSSNLDPTRKYPSLFEPVYGSSFDIREGSRKFCGHSLEWSRIVAMVR
jgi:isocitrate/isopropylmalate dehydrogenase